MRPRGRRSGVGGAVAESCTASSAGAASSVATGEAVAPSSVALRLRGFRGIDCWAVHAGHNGVFELGNRWLERGVDRFESRRVDDELGSLHRFSGADGHCLGDDALTHIAGGIQIERQRIETRKIEIVIEAWEEGGNGTKLTQVLLAARAVTQMRFEGNMLVIWKRTQNVRSNSVM